MKRRTDRSALAAYSVAASVLVLSLCLALAPGTGAQNGATGTPAAPDRYLPGPPPGSEPVMSQWLSPDGSQPMPYAEWLARQPAPAPLYLERVYPLPELRRAPTGRLIHALVNPSVYEGIKAALDQWAADLEAEGWDASIYKATFPSASDLRDHLASVDALEACLLVGDFPVPWYEIGTDQFPIDLYYMDLDGTWLDGNENGVYDGHAGHTAPEIALGRLTAGPLTYGDGETSLLANYFAKNHAYRAGDLSLPSRALMYADDDWAVNGELWSAQGLRVLYPDTTAIYNPLATTGKDYRQRLSEGYEWVQVHAHAYPGGQHFDPFVLVNFQPRTTPAPTGYQPDSGAVYGYQGAGLYFGWNADNQEGTRERQTSYPLEYDTFIHMQAPENPDAYWEIAVPPGAYQVDLVAGDAENTDSVYKIEAEGQLALDGVPTSTDPFVEGTAEVIVNDGRLTIANAAGAVNNKLAFVRIRASAGDDWLTSRDLYELDPHAFFYNLYSCSAASYVYADYMGGWYIFADTYGLAAVGTTKSGGMHGFHHFYGPMARGETLGDGFRNWLALFGIYSQVWHYGATLLGDPTLTPTNPKAELGPQSLTKDIRYGAQATRRLDLSNAGNGILSYQLAEFALQHYKAQIFLPAMIQARPSGAGSTSSSAQEPDTGPASASAHASTVYTYKDSSQVGGPAYQWIEVAPPAGGSGTEITALRRAHEGYFWPLSLPFTFPFYDTNHTALAVASNGALYFQDKPLGPDNVAIPGENADQVDALIAHFWDDLNVGAGGVYYQDLGDIFVVEYYRVFGAPEAGEGTWEVILFEDGNILFQYQDVTLQGWGRGLGREATVGIQGDPAHGLQYSYNTPALWDGLAICFAYPGNASDCSSSVSWLSVEPSAGTLAAGEATEIEVTFDAGVPAVEPMGSYYARLILQSNDPSAPLVQVPVEMRVVPPDAWGELEGMVRGLGYCDANPAPLAGAAVMIQGDGGGSWLLTTGSDGGYGAWINEAESPLTVTASHPEHKTGVETGVEIRDQVTTALDFDLRWLEPCAGVSPAAIQVTLAPGETTTATLTISNRGAADLGLKLAQEGDPAPWLSFAPEVGTVAPDSQQPVDLFFDASLPESSRPGAYRADLSVETDDPFTPVWKMPVTMTVQFEQILFLPFITR